ncbi:MAG: TIGR03790 family protein, partial [Verrucomicrobiales bacterium]
MDVTKGEGYKIGDDWLRNIATAYHHLGIPTYIDNHPERLPTNFPLGEDTILYFGWYAPTVEGPFINPEFKFKTGAVACHIHSYSATTIRKHRQWWVGPLVAQGAAAALGNVYEPFLTYTTHLDLFNARLLEGYTFAEAAWMATPAVSWMSIMVGDPLYQPFFPTRTYGNTPDPDFKALRLGLNRWRDQPELYEKLAFAVEKLKSAKLQEAIGLRYRYDLKFELAAAAFSKARAMFRGRDDQLRMDLYRIELLRSQDQEEEALSALRKILPVYEDMPGALAIEALLNQMDPPPPPPPPPAK